VRVGDVVVPEAIVPVVLPSQPLPTALPSQPPPAPRLPPPPPPPPEARTLLQVAVSAPAGRARTSGPNLFVEDRAPTSLRTGEPAVIAVQFEPESPVTEGALLPPRRREHLRPGDGARRRGRVPAGGDPSGDGDAGQLRVLRGGRPPRRPHRASRRQRQRPAPRRGAAAPAAPHTPLGAGVEITTQPGANADPGVWLLVEVGREFGRHLTVTARRLRLAPRRRRGLHRRRQRPARLLSATPLRGAADCSTTRAPP